MSQRFKTLFNQAPRESGCILHSKDDDLKHSRSNKCDQKIMHNCPRCDEYLENLSVGVLRAIDERAAEVVGEGASEVRQDAERLDRMLVYSGFV